MSVLETRYHQESLSGTLSPFFINETPSELPVVDQLTLDRIDQLPQRAANYQSAKDELEQLGPETLAEYQRILGNLATYGSDHPTLVQVEQLLARKHAYSDAASLINRSADTLAKVIRRSMRPQLRVIGANVYWLHADARQLWLCGGDEADRIVYFGRVSVPTDSSSRLARLEDNIRFIRDIAATRAA